MLRRPKPSDSEADLLQDQERFLASGARSTVKVIRRPDKRRGGGGGGEAAGVDEGNGERQRDVVTIADLPDELPSLTPAPSKKSCFTTSQVHFEHQDTAESLDQHDTHITAVLTRIVERDTSYTPISLPAFTDTAFPRVLHRTEADDKVPALPAGGRKSIFARQIAAEKRTEVSASSPGAAVCEAREPDGLPAGTSMETELPPASPPREASGPRLLSGQGLGGPDSSAETQRIHQENQSKLQGMSRVEILEEQKRLLAELDPRLVDFIKARKPTPSPAEPDTRGDGRSEEEGTARNVPRRPAVSGDISAPLVGPRPVPQDLEMEKEEEDMDMEEEEEEEPTPLPPITELELPVKPEKQWVHMGQLEPDKLEWTRDLPAPKRQGTKKAMQARFDFTGSLIPPTEDLPTHLGLHHHGEEPELAGYSLQELFHLSRSQVIQQRSLSLNTLASIIVKARAGEYAAVLRGSVTATLLDAGLLFLLRFALDDGVEGVMAAAVHALRALLVSDEDEEFTDSSFSWLQGLACFPLVPSGKEQEEEEEEEDDQGLPENMRLTDKEKEERKNDYDVARRDVVKGLLRMKLLARLRYILEVMRPSPRVVQDLLDVLTRIARHSSHAATQVLDCPRLMDVVMSEFLPTSWAVPSVPAPLSVYGLPLAGAVKLLRVLATSGRHACARLLSSLGMRERLTRLLSPEPSELQLEPGQALLLSTEAYRLWAVAASYGQACDTYIELYSVLVRTVHRALDPSDPLLALQLQRALALLTLLTQVTHTAGCHQELQAAVLNSAGGECLPPPPVSWSHVAGLQASLVGQLKGLVRGLDEPGGRRESCLTLIPAYLLYLGAYYHQLPQQNSFKPVDTLQELELLTSEVLQPLMSHNAVQHIMTNLKSCSAVCNLQGRGAGPESVPSLPGLASAGWRDRPGLAVPSSPFPLLTALCLLLDSVTGIHKGLSRKFSGLLVLEPVIGYLGSCSLATPTLTDASAWVLRHEHHLLYLLLRLAHKLAPKDPDVARHASLFHQVALALLPWLLPGSEHLAHDLLCTVVFSKDFIPEGHSGGPEALELADLKLNRPAVAAGAPGHQALGPLLREACAQLPSLRACFLAHLAHLEPAVLSSKDAYLGRTPWTRSQLLPELGAGPTLPADWPFLPLVSLYERTAGGSVDGGGLQVEELPRGSLQTVCHGLQWLLLLEVWREPALKAVLPVAKLARLSCVFLSSSDLFLERPVQRLLWALLRLLTRPDRLDSLDLNHPPPGLASFQDLFTALLSQYEAVSFGDPLFGCWVLLPLQRRYNTAMRLAVFGEHVGALRSLGVTLDQLSIPLERFTSPPETSLPLLQLYFRCLVTGSLRQHWCPVLYVVALAHLNTFIFSQGPAEQEVKAARRSMLRKIYYLTDKVLKDHLLLFRGAPQQRPSELGFDTYEQLPPIRAKHLESVLAGAGAGGGGGDGGGGHEETR